VFRPRGAVSTAAGGALFDPLAELYERHAEVNTTVCPALAHRGPRRHRGRRPAPAYSATRSLAVSCQEPTTRRARKPKNQKTTTPSSEDRITAPKSCSDRRPCR